MESTYRQLKEDVLGHYDSFVQMISEVSSFVQKLNAEMLGTESPYDHSLKVLSEKAEDLKKDKFMLMVVGEAKSGKSTFINAYLKKDILPMDVKQCTNAIVEIRDGEKYRLIATYADGTIKVIDNDAEIGQFMKENAAMDDEYREIPVSLINSELLMKWQDKPESEDDINDLLKHVAEDNIHRLPQEEYEKKIRKYIRQRKGSWRQLVKTIVIEYPFEDQELKGIEILDTPGVNAEGKVGDITNEFVEKANAVMFLKPIAGSALESSSFKKFLNSKSADRNKNAMFLVLTRAANENGKNTEEILQEAFKQFGNINEHQIIPVDSKAELFANSIDGLSSDELKRKLMELKANIEIDSFLLLPWFESNGDKDKYLDEVRKLSNFEEMRNRLNLFAHKHEYLALSGFLDIMIKVSDQASAIISELVGTLEQKAEDPHQLNEKLQEKKRELDKVTAKINETIQEISEKYTLPEVGEIVKKTGEVMSEYAKEIAAVDNSANDGVEQLQKITLRKLDILSAMAEELQKNIVSECDERLLDCSKEISKDIDYRILKPNLTTEAVDAIKAKCKSDSYETKVVKSRSKAPLLGLAGMLFGPIGWGVAAGSAALYGLGLFENTEYVSEFSKSKYFDEVKAELTPKVARMKSDVESLLQDFAVKIINAYTNALNGNAVRLKKQYDAILQAKLTAEVLQEQIRQGKERREKLNSIFLNIQRIKSGIDKNVE